MFDEQWTIQAVREWGDWQLEPYIHDIDERLAQINYLLTGMMDWNYAQLSNNLNTVLEDEKRLRFMVAVRAIKGGQPVQYALGHAAFYGREFQVDRRVLIPRQETEELVEWVLTDHPADTKQRVLDIGTGSGAIAVSLSAERTSWTVVGADISEDALAVAKENAQLYAPSVQLLQSDLFTGVTGTFDIIVANPPYISRDEQSLMDDSVVMFEPDIALYADDDGLALYKKMATDLLAFLKPGGAAYFEIGYQQGKKLVDLFRTLPHVIVTLRQDLSGHDRMIKVLREM
ncbi:peptide chain release factor N(5)-glutamine methyltransferase [Weissella paramesenteroides]|uniref:peptide chain release factor N(5)-glutamine methyltransferase n=1 Tax=Weissella paramesenteroides TaxID=1249 RepID=UPI0021AE41A9|nr:peptide chain release factor N(5)-glutamine methyltransferase [Weissella paramesenteroides]MCS9984804.1 peptide chain release factor N(5)-glutamine methyltransferase [Weissella paramesenteroides]MCS9998606.1 peptide chain release factor N(5)-glutamine methyltransferase [Weissella paramesenteroides]MCT0260329.1 peptide chain release factor N(5)-glutamine methyltransferase [Weissella paramesenteroides]